MQLENKKRTRARRGDTIVETMFAFAIFGLIAIINIQIMQRGTRLNQSALEINLAREQITSQAEALRLLNSAYIAEFISNQGNQSACLPNSNTPKCIWERVINQKVNPDSIISLSEVANSRCTAPGNAFVLDYRFNGLPQMRKTALQTAKLFPRIVYRNATDSNDIESGVSYVYQSAEGIWVEAVNGDGTYYDFLIRACWDSPAGQVPTTLETMVRLYVPR